MTSQNPETVAQEIAAQIAMEYPGTSYDLHTGAVIVPVQDGSSWAFGTASGVVWGADLVDETGELRRSITFSGLPAETVDLAEIVWTIRDFLRASRVDALIARIAATRKDDELDAADLRNESSTDLPDLIGEWVDEARRLERRTR